jgi:hypothetical protein
MAQVGVDEEPIMQTNVARKSTLPSSVVLWELLSKYDGNPPIEEFEQAGFRRCEALSFLQRRAGVTNVPECLQG